MVRIFGVDELGVFNERPLPDIIEDLKLNFRLFHGPEITLRPGDPDLQLIESIAPEFRIYWSALKGAFLQLFISTATGDALEKACKIVRLSRKLAAKSKGEVTFARTTPAPGGGITIPAGTVVETEAGIQFKTDAELVIPEGDTEITGAVTAAEPGTAGNVGVSTITTLVSTVTGVNSVTNAAETTGGTEDETDDSLRARALTNPTSGGNGTVNAIRSNLLNNVSGVTAAVVIANNTAVEDGDGRPPNSVEAFVLGGDAADIREELFVRVVAGVETYGTQSGTVTDEDGNEYTIKFSRPTEATIYVSITVVTNTDFDTTNGPNAIRDAIIGYVGGTLTNGSLAPGLSLGEDVIRAEVIAAIMAVTGVKNITTLKIDTVNPPIATTGDVTVDPSEIARMETASGIDVTVT